MASKVALGFGSCSLYCDNVNGTIENSKEPRSYKREKHIKRKYHLLRNIVQKGNEIVSKVDATEKLVDLFTKSVPT